MIVERWILARLRNQRFFSLEEVNAAIRPLQDLLNNKVTRHLGASRKDLFLRLDKPVLKALPIEPYVYAEWKQCRAGLDYHINVAGHYYSVPHHLLKQPIWARITAQTLEAYHDGQRVASHVLVTGDKRHSTHKNHMPAHHRFREDWAPEIIRQKAAKIGPNVEAFAEIILSQRRHPEKGYRACQGVIRLSKEFGGERLDAACARAIAIKASSYSSLHSILKNGLDRQGLAQVTEEPAITHTNIRGANYFH